MQIRVVMMGEAPAAYTLNTQPQPLVPRTPAAYCSQSASQTDWQIDRQPAKKLDSQPSSQTVSQSVS